MATPGAFTTDNIPTSLLYTELMDSIERHNENSRSYKDLFCGAPTKKSTVQVRERGVDFQLSASDTTKPDMQHVPRRTRSLREPQRWVLNESITRRAWEEGMSSDEVREHGREALDADFRTVTDSILQEALTDGGWYDGTLIPPPFKQNTFLVTHDHYLARAAGGVPALSDFTLAKTHILEHGYTDVSRMVAFINNQQAEEIENITEWGTYVGPATSLMDTLQAMGMTPSFRAGGVAVVADDWIPENYMLMVSFQVKPMMWRIPEGSGGVENLMSFTSTSQGETPSLQYQWIEEYARWTSSTIIHPGAGVAYYLDGAAWVDSTGWSHSG